MQYISHYQSPLGDMTMGSDGEALLGLWFDDQKYFASTVSGDAITRELPVFEQTKQWLDLYFCGQIPDFMPPLWMKGSEFRQAVWKLLQEIPYGKTVTYGDLAQQIAKERGLKRMSAQAVGGAAGHNPISILVPCHRVLGSDGSLTGYAGGVERKAKLLMLEQTQRDKNQ